VPAGGRIITLRQDGSISAIPTLTSPRPKLINVPSVDIVQ
jgi:hypothetical protein